MIKVKKEVVEEKIPKENINQEKKNLTKTNMRKKKSTVHQGYIDVQISIHKMENSSAFLSCKTRQFCKYGTLREKGRIGKQRETNPDKWLLSFKALVVIDFLFFFFF